MFDLMFHLFTLHNFYFCLYSMIFDPRMYHHRFVEGSSHHMRLSPTYLGENVVFMTNSDFCNNFQNNSLKLSFSSESVRM